MTETVISNSDKKERRVCERINLNRSVLLKFSNGQTVCGTTRDVSLGGVRIATEDSRTEQWHEQWHEQDALLYIKLVDGKLSPEYPCTIVRCDSGSICLKLDKKKAASFGAMLTRGILKRKQSSI